MNKSSAISSTRSERIRNRLLKTTESIFASRGFRRLALQEIALRSQTNLVSVHFHFGSKEVMVLGRLQGRLKPIKHRGMQQLAEPKEKPEGKPLSTWDILRALIHPIGEEIPKNTNTHQPFTQLVVRTFTEPAKFIQTMFRKSFGEMCGKFMEELRKTYPEVKDQDLYWNLYRHLFHVWGFEPASTTRFFQRNTRGGGH